MQVCAHIVYIFINVQVVMCRHYGIVLTHSSVCVHTLLECTPLFVSVNTCSEYSHVKFMCVHILYISTHKYVTVYMIFVCTHTCTQSEHAL